MDAERAAYDAAWEAELDRREAAADADPSSELPAEEALAAIRHCNDPPQRGLRAPPTGAASA